MEQDQAKGGMDITQAPSLRLVVPPSPPLFATHSCLHRLGGSGSGSRAFSGACNSREAGWRITRAESESERDGASASRRALRRATSFALLRGHSARFGVLMDSTRHSL